MKTILKTFNILILLVFISTHASAEHKELAYIGLSLNNFKSVSKNYCSTKIKSALIKEFTYMQGTLSTNSPGYGFTLSTPLKKQTLKYFGGVTLFVPKIKQSEDDIKYFETKYNPDLSSNPVLFKAFSPKPIKLTIDNQACEISTILDLSRNGGYAARQHPLKAKFSITCKSNNKISKCNLEANGTHYQGGL